ncbi:TetR/AcrR family transcriptional regulator [Actinomadura fibrosa]|uniref:TetR/AcrR family transcriptional regulator n=1 Tax=Actinomadura fibrosa TaxID=111802 RepID=A0ABW2XDT5_9ACTN|nr:TetR/AcrR family transcriptional regulator [Actinomadura fibrosa]
MPATTKAARTRQRLLEAAIARFSKDGYRGTSIAEITRDAKLSGTAAYVYFPNKEALFVAAVDADATAVIEEGLACLAEFSSQEHWRDTMMSTLLQALAHHPLAHRILKGLEPEFTVRLLSIPALERLREESAARLRGQQEEGTVRPDIDPDQMAHGLVTLTLSMLMALTQTGVEPSVLLGPGVAAVFNAALNPLTSAQEQDRTAQQSGRDHL